MQLFRCLPLYILRGLLPAMLYAVFLCYWRLCLYGFVYIADALANLKFFYSFYEIKTKLEYLNYMKDNEQNIYFHA